MADIVLNSGMTVILTEGGVGSGGDNDSRFPHYPQNIGVFVPKAGGGFTRGKSARTNGYYSYIQTEAGKGDYALVKNCDRHKLTGSEASGIAGGVLGDWLNNGRVGSSGVTIALGVDLSARYGTNKQKVINDFTAAGMPEYGQILSVAAGINGVEASIMATKLRGQVTLSKQQILDLVNVIWQGYEQTARSRINFSGLYPPLQEIVTKMAYGNANFITNLGLDGKIQGKSPLEQCKMMLTAMVTSADQAWFTALISFTKKLISSLEKGDTITIEKKKLDLTALLDENNATANWIGELKGDLRASILVTDVQNLLGLKADGVFGPGTAKALVEYQKKNGLSPTGKIDKATRDYLFNNNILNRQAIGSAKANPDTGKIEYNNGGNTNPNNGGNTNPNNGGNTNNNAAILEAVKTAFAGKGSISGSVGVGGENKKQDVLVVRALLSHLKYLNHTLTEMAGNLAVVTATSPALEAAIRKLQADYGVAKPDGCVDPDGDTIKWLNGAPKPQPNNPNNNPPSNIDANLQKAQQVLIDNGYLAPTYFSKKQNKDVSNADGIMGAGTQAALRDFQSEHQLEATGALDAATQAVIFDPKRVHKKGDIPIQPASLDANIFPCFN